MTTPSTEHTMAEMTFPVRPQVRALFRFLGSVITCAVLTTGCGTATMDTADVETPGVTEDVIRVGMTADLTGPVAFLGQELSAGARLYFDLVNDRGGVYGRRLELIVEDDGYQPARTIAAYRKLLDRDGVFAFMATVGTATTLAIKPAADRDRVPVVPVASFSSTSYTPPSRYVFGIDPSYWLNSWIMVHHLVETGEAADAKLGVIYQDDDLGADGLSGLREAAAHYDVPIVAEEGHRRGAIDFSSQVLSLRQAGATHVVLWTLIRESAAILKEADGLGWTPEFLSWTVLGDQSFVELAGTSAGNLRFVNVVDLESGTPQMRDYLDTVQQRDPEGTPGFYHVFGFTGAQIFVEALERAGRDLTRDGLVAALETFDGWDDNAIQLPLTYGPGLRGGSTTRTFMAAVDVEHGRLVRVTEDAVFELPERMERGH